jgi:hypothetical protein
MSAINNMDTETRHYMEHLTLTEGDWKSLYLKMWPDNVIADGRSIDTKEDLKWLIEDVLRIGRVERIDEVVKDMRNGNTNRSAFIHFVMWDSKYGLETREEIDTNGIFNASKSRTTMLDFQNSNSRYTHTQPFFAFRKNINPCSVATMDDLTKEQLIRRCKDMEEAFKTKTLFVQDFIENERSSLIDEIKLHREIISKHNTETDKQ